MTTLDEARDQVDWMITMNYPDTARVIRDLIAMVEASRTVTDAEVEEAVDAIKSIPSAGGGAIALYQETLRNLIAPALIEKIARAALEAAAAARSQANGTNAKAAPMSGLNREDSHDH